MPTDAKCGLLVGVAVVIAVAILFFQKDPANTPEATVSVIQPKVTAKNTSAPPSLIRPVSHVKSGD